jgi:hypothetical protein
MKPAYLLSLLVVVVSFSSCYLDEFGTDRIAVTYDTVPFDRIRLETSSDVRIIQSNTFKVVVRGEERDVDDTEVRVNDDRLVIEEHGFIDGDHEIEIYVPEISELNSVGSSLVYGESEFTQNRSMDIRLSGSGEIDFYADVDNLDVSLTGSGYIYLDGFADNADFDISGSGWIRSFPCATDIMDLRIEGSGSAEVFVDTDLDIVITGSGDVFYKGHPQVSVEITGSGHVFDAN